MGLKAFGKSLVLPLPLQLLRGLRAGSWTPDSSLPLCSIPPSWPHGLLEARPLLCCGRTLTPKCSSQGLTQTGLSLGERQKAHPVCPSCQVG